MIYIDTSVLLARMLSEDRQPPPWIWDETLVSSRLMDSARSDFICLVLPYQKGLESMWVKTARTNADTGARFFGKRDASGGIAGRTHVPTLWPLATPHICRGH